ncbi:DUF4148 domain-containing protein [Burkholderia sp. WSM2230]|uniref:DUF4148 domain-containing protein n=1 Tax=Burkholderia sp. WSM2230 TaxID=944435 RepID=UPI000416A310|nr:DUF4148 domain-containing protein [Burkholderia sp. WSM2230]
MKESHAKRASCRAFFTLVSTVALVLSSTWARAQASPEASHPLTRAEVMHELEELEAAGYTPSRGDDSEYPADIQEAERKLAAMQAAQQSAQMNQEPAMQAMPMQ